MSKSLKVIYEDGVLKPLEKINLKEHQRLELVIKKIIPVSGSSVRDSPLRLIGLFDSEVDDLSTNHDTYLYNQLEEK